MVTPKVSIITPFLNAEKFLKEAIESVLDQTYDHWELLLIDDGSTDQSTQLAVDFAKKFPEKIRYLCHPGHRNRGASASRNLGIQHAEGDFLAFLDSDDVWLQRKLEHQVPLLQSHPEADVLFGETLVWYSWTQNAQDIPLDHAWAVWKSFGIQANTLIHPPKLLDLLIRFSVMPCLCSLLIRHAVVECIGAFEERFTHVYTDQVFYAKLCRIATILIADGCWEKYRQHEDSCCHQVEKQGEAWRAKRSFLLWLKAYLSAQGCRKTDTWNTLQIALKPFRHPIFYRLGPVLHRLLGRNWALLRNAVKNVLTDRKVNNNASSEAPSVWEGYLDSVDCQTILGWARNASKPDTQVKVDIYDGELFLCTASADEFRQDLLAAGKGSGHHAFRCIFPFWLRDGKSHAIHARISGTAFELAPTPKVIQCELQIDMDFKKFKEKLKAIIPRMFRHNTDQRSPAVNKVRFGDLRRVVPISNVWGFDRGRPIDRYYIELFLRRHKGDIQGRVLEIGDDSYTLKYGEHRITQSDVLNLQPGNPKTTMVADLTDAPHIPGNTFDCIIFTQTLQLIYDVRAALRTLRRILKPGGVLLATLPGISQTYDPEWGGHWCWNFTPISARKLFAEVFPMQSLEVETHGNILAAVAFLHGLAAEEFSKAELDYHDPGYTVTITVRAIKDA